MAVVATVEVTPSEELRALQLDLAFDCGRVLNRDAGLAQMQGGMISGMNMALNEELQVLDGRIVAGNFDQCTLRRMADTPRNLRVHFDAPSGHDRYNEAGEPPIGPIAPPIANAVFRAIGRRVRDAVAPASPMQSRPRSVAADESCGPERSTVARSKHT